jgi:hypothetical protein
MVTSIAAEWRTLVDGGNHDDLSSGHNVFLMSTRLHYLTILLGVDRNTSLTTTGKVARTDNWPTAQKTPFSSHLHPKVGCLHFHLESSCNGCFQETQSKLFKRTNGGKNAHLCTASKH